MIPSSGHISIKRTPRPAVAALLVVLVNLALLPCSMALEIVEEGHDCCPPELRLDTADCCEIDEANVGSPGGSFKFDSPDVEAAAVTFPTMADPESRPGHPAAADPPGDQPPRVALHKLNCVYLD